MVESVLTFLVPKTRVLVVLKLDTEVDNSGANVRPQDHKVLNHDIRAPKVF